MLVCDRCNQEFANDEITIYDCNGNENSSDEMSIEQNAQNPDWCAEKYCGHCDELRSTP